MANIGAFKDAPTVRRVAKATRWVEQQPKGHETADYGTGPLAVGNNEGVDVGSTISFLITGDHSAGAVYVGKSFTDVPTDGADVAPSGSLAESDVGTLAGANDLLILNLVELGSSATGHDLTAVVNTDRFSLYGVGRVAHINEDGTKVVHTAMYYVGCTDDDGGG